MPSRGSVDATLPPIRLQLLGAFRVERNTHPVQCLRRKEEALLAYLAFFPQAQSRDKIAALFWGDSTDQAARRSPRVALTALRKHLDPAFFLADGESIFIRPYNRRSHDHHLALAQSQLDAETFKKAWTEGDTMTSEQAIHYALQ